MGKKLNELPDADPISGTDYLALWQSAGTPKKLRKVTASSMQTYVLGSHNHDNRYYTESEIDAMLTGLHTHSNLAILNTFTKTQSTLETERDTAISNAIAALVDSSPSTLDTLNELAAALGDDPNFSTTILASLGNKSDVGHTHSVFSQLADGFVPAYPSTPPAASAMYFLSNGSWVSKSFSEDGHGHSLAALEAGGATIGQLLAWSGTQWQPVSPDYAPSAHTHLLSDLEQTLANTGQVITWSGTAWVAADLPPAVTDHGALTGLSDDDHTQYHTDARGDARYSLLGHSHDDRYYTESEIDTLLAAKADASHTHDDFVTAAGAGFVPSPYDNGDLIQAPSGYKYALGITGWTTFYTDVYIDALLSDKADVGHTHSWSDITDWTNLVDWSLRTLKNNLGNTTLNWGANLLSGAWYADTSVSPAVTNVGTLGTTSYRWNNVHATNITLNNPSAADSGISMARSTSAAGYVKATNAASGNGLHIGATVGTVVMDNAVTFANTTESSSSTTGSIICLGGIGTAKNITCNQNILAGLTLYSYLQVYAQLNGSDTVGGGARIGVLNTAGSANWFWQLSASNHLDLWNTSTHRARWSSTGLNLVTGSLAIAGTQVVGAQSAAVADATDSASAITQLNALLARLRAHGLIAT